MIKDLAVSCEIGIYNYVKKEKSIYYEFHRRNNSFSFNLGYNF